MKRLLKMILVAFSLFLFLNLIAMYWLQTGILHNYDSFLSQSVVGKRKLLTTNVPYRPFGFDGKRSSNSKKNKIHIDSLLDLFPSAPASYGFFLERDKNYNADNTFEIHKSEDRLIKQLKTKMKVRSNYTNSILVYFHDNSLSNEEFLRSDCPVKNCQFKKKPEDFETAEAVLFKEFPKDLKRPLSKKNQIWIYYQLEAPVHTLSIPEGIVVNWTATYRPDSVIQTPYGKFHSKEKIDKPIAQFNYAKYKTKLVAWFVSNCRDDNGRMEFVRELQKYINVDIYGDCGTLECGPKDPNECREMLKNDYKFYLAFENTNCKGYITEKFFKCYRNDVIPIVMGAPIEDYKSIAPTHSFIHVDQFETPRDLARHLHLLNTHHSLYNRYFEWKATHEMIDTKFMCRLCILLESAPHIKMSYHDINGWWVNGQCLSLGKHQNWTTWT